MEEVGAHVHLAELPDTRAGATCQVKAYVTSPHFDYDASQVTDAFESPLQLLDLQDTEDALLILGLFMDRWRRPSPLQTCRQTPCTCPSG